MNIDPQYTTGISGQRPVGAVPGPRSQGRAGGGTGDRVDLSARASDFQRLRARLAGTPEVRAERVAALRQKLALEEYALAAERIAAALLEDESVAPLLLDASR